MEKYNLQTLATVNSSFYLQKCKIIFDVDCAARGCQVYLDRVARSNLIIFKH